GVLYKIQVGEITVQRTIDLGLGAGLLTGLGSSAADCLYACVGVFGLTFISDFLLKYQRIITVMGGLFVLIMGISGLLKKPEDNALQKSAEGAKMFLSSFTVGITNPAAILTFLFAFAYFGIGEISGAANSVLLVLGVLIGTYVWWSVLSGTVCIIKRRSGNRRLPYLNKIFGVILTVFGAVILVKAFL
ncbi:MAG: LysE family transporter, partial [Ruminiclostridium sp.]|nr:LysE family transporter [Ruminiclostridium sp.]